MALPKQELTKIYGLLAEFPEDETKPEFMNKKFNELLLNDNYLDEEIVKLQVVAAAKTDNSTFEVVKMELEDAIMLKVSNFDYDTDKMATDNEIGTLKATNLLLQSDVNKRVLKETYNTDKAALESSIAEKTTTSLNGAQTNVNFISDTTGIKSINDTPFSSEGVVTKGIKQKQINDLFYTQQSREYVADANGVINVTTGLNNGYITSGKIEGRSVFNILPTEQVTLTGDGVNWNGSIISFKSQLLPSTAYTLIVEVTENTLENDFLVTAPNSNRAISNSNNKIPKKSLGIFYFNVTTASDFTGITNTLCSEVVIAETGRIKFRRCLIEGSNVKLNSYIPFGLSSSKVIISNNGNKYPFYATETDELNNTVITLGSTATKKDTLEIKEDGSAIYTQNTQNNADSSARVDLATPTVTTIDKSLVPTILTQATNTFIFGEGVIATSSSIKVPVDKSNEVTMNGENTNIDFVKNSDGNVAQLVAKGQTIDLVGKISDNSIDNSKVTEPLSKVIPWSVPNIITTTTTIGDKQISLGGIFVITDNFLKFLNMTTTTYTIPDGYYLILDFSARMIATEKASTFVKNGNKYILFSNFSGFLQSPIPFYQCYLHNIYNPQTVKRVSGILTVGKEGADFTTIGGALTYAKTIQSVTNKITIKVAPGVYEEVVNVYGNNYISIIGENKQTCILIDNSGQYANAPLRIQGSAYIANMTIISTHNNDSTTAVDSLRAYAVHADDVGEGTTEFNNCILISYQNAAIGSGLHTNQTLKLINCELYSYTPTESSMTMNGAFYCHDGTGATNQKLIVKDCIIKSLNSFSMFLHAAYGTPMTATFYNNIFYSEQLGKDSIKLSTAISGISGNITLTNDSFGNNVTTLNA